ncbi:hypothetical protein [Negadavirga shengliensis]|uniref:SPOR domain-containing protein n=1 Tax=Negadavirga shengliensis TaxID=1389218 RepID=A0ABV9SW10_9BACT
MIYKKAGFWISLLLLTSSCGIFNIKKGGAAADLYANYSEDLSDVRIRFDDLPKVAAFEAGEGTVPPVDAELNQALQRIARENGEEWFYNGFTILIYSGVDRDEAFKTRNRLYSEFPDIQTDMQYQQPRYLVKVGKYIHRIEALAWYEKLKKEFPASRIIQDRFQRNRQDENPENTQNVDQ